jgi:hypothetical protein
LQSIRYVSLVVDAEDVAVVPFDNGQPATSTVTIFVAVDVTVTVCMPFDAAVGVGAGVGLRAEFRVGVRIGELTSAQLEIELVFESI